MDRTILESFVVLCDIVASPFSAEAKEKALAGDWGWLVSQDTNPSLYESAHAYFGDAQVSAYLSKFPGFDLFNSDIRKAKAEATFWEAERQCFVTNRRLDNLLGDPFHFGEEVRNFIKEWRTEIHSCLGSVPDYTILSGGKFGPGSTYANKRDEILLADKLAENYTVTDNAESLLPFLEGTAWLRHAARSGYQVYSDYAVTDSGLSYRNDTTYATRLFDVVRGNRFTTVPKNAKTDRGICIEASANVYLQLAVGGELSNLLKRRYGWNKKNCQEYHRLLARIASLTGACATIDLSNASDTVSIALVELLLPPAWFSLLGKLRSTHTEIGGKWVRLEKFSSMGNGFTFELETLIFRTLVETVMRLEGVREDPFTPGVDCSVFGDDIIVPTSVSSSAVAALKFFGFTPNQKKTFLDGPFRESCGGDYYRGYDVRPHSVREDLVEPHNYIALANGIRRFRQRYEKTSPWVATHKFWFAVVDSIPKPIADCRGPEALGDLVLNDDDHVWLRRVHVRNSVRYLRVWRPVPNKRKAWDQYRPGVVMACALYGVPDGIPPISIGDDASESWRRSGVVPRVSGSYVSGYRFGRVAYS